jgi:cold shock CspA family protein
MRDSRINQGNQNVRKKADNTNTAEALGRLLFFDYRKNKFGFITPIHSKIKIEQDRIFVPYESLTMDHELQEGDLLAFQLQKTKKGFSAIHVVKANLDTIESYSDAINFDDLKEAISNTRELDPKPLDDKHRRTILRVTSRFCDSNTWSYISYTQNQDLIDQYIKQVIPQIKDEAKSIFLKAAFNFAFLELAISSWKSMNEIDLRAIIQSIPKFAQKIRIPPSFEHILLAINWSQEDLADINIRIENDNLRSQLLSNFTFRSNTWKFVLETFFPFSSATKIEIQKLKSNFAAEKDILTPQTILQVFEKCNIYGFLRDDHELLKTLQKTKCDKIVVRHILQQFGDVTPQKHLQAFVSCCIPNLTSSEVVELIKFNKERDTLAKLLIVEEVRSQTKATHPNFSALLAFCKDKTCATLMKYFLDEISKVKDGRLTLDVLKLTEERGHEKARKAAYGSLVFCSEEDVLGFLIHLRKFQDLAFLNKWNRPLADFVRFARLKDNFILNDDIRLFLNKNTGVVQCFTIKLLAYHLHRKSISKEEFINFTGSYEWTEISALMIKDFVNESMKPKPVFFETLPTLFYEHFKILLDSDLTPEAFKLNFSIGNILKACQGRQIYVVKPWEKDNKTRYYYAGRLTTRTEPPMSCFCEGRPWKKVQYWNSETNKPTDREYELYWCRGKSCAERNDHTEYMSSFHKWTLVEIANTLEIRLEKITLAYITGWANRMNEIIKSLLCRECDQVLRPLPFRPKTLGHYAVPVFNCVNPNCGQHNKPVRFTHCLNNKCPSHVTSSPLDSRDCKSCKPNDPNHSGLECNHCRQPCPSCSGSAKKIVVEQEWQV